MDYLPNIQAVDLFAGKVMPQVLEVIPGPLASLSLAARQRLLSARWQGLNGTIVTGPVADVRPWLWLQTSTPLMIARGVQNKVLEAMAMARAVLLMPCCGHGIYAADGEAFGMEQRPARPRCPRACSSGEQALNAMGVAARRHVIESAAAGTAVHLARVAQGAPARSGR